jgi:hypothetical protein
MKTSGVCICGHLAMEHVFFKHGRGEVMCTGTGTPEGSCDCRQYEAEIDQDEEREELR